MSTSSDTTRKYGSLFFIAALAVLFALQWGPGSQGCDRRVDTTENAATVNGKPIALKDFARAYSQQADNFRRQGLPNDLIKQFGVQKQVMEQLVNGELLAQAAEARGLHTSDDDLKKTLRDVEFFKKDGKWSAEAYQNYVRNYEGTTEVLFEDKLRRQLAAQKLLQLVESSVAVSDEEVKAKYEKEGDTANATFVRFTAAQFADKVGVPKPAEVAAWAANNTGAIAAFYEQNKFSYFVPEKVKLRQIVLRVPADADAAKKEEVRARAEGVRKALVDEKKDFAEIAKAVSEDLETREKGGDLGYVERLALPGAFADLAFSANPGDITALVETQAGWFIGKVEEKKAPEQKPLDAVKDEIAQQLFVKEKAKALAQAEAQKALAEVQKGKTLQELFPAAPSDGSNPFQLGVALKPEAKTTGEFNSTMDTVPSLGAEPSVKAAIFARKAPGLIEEPLAIADGFVLVNIDARAEPNDADFEKKKDELKLEAIKGKQFETRESFVKALKQGGTVVTNDAAIEKIIDA